MPYVHIVDDARKIVVSRAWGVVTDEDMHAATVALRAEPCFRPEFHQLADFRGVTQAAVTGAGIRRLGELSPFGVGARRAAVVGTAVAMGLTRMYASRRGDTPDEVRAFEDVTAALDWLGVAERDRAAVTAILEGRE